MQSLCVSFSKHVLQKHGWDCCQLKALQRLLVWGPVFDSMLRQSLFKWHQRAETLTTLREIGTISAGHQGTITRGLIRRVDWSSTLFHRTHRYQFYHKIKFKIASPKCAVILIWSGICLQGVIFLAVGTLLLWCSVIPSLKQWYIKAMKQRILALHLIAFYLHAINWKSTSCLKLRFYIHTRWKRRKW